MKVRYTIDALLHIAAIHTYINERNPVARVFLEIFRLLKYLEFADPDGLPDDRVKTAACVFSLVISEARQLVSYIEKRALVSLPHGSAARDACDGRELQAHRRAGLCA